MERSELPLFNDNTMKLGIFCMNVSGGTFMTTAEGIITPTWAENARIARAVDQAGWEFLLPLGRWRGLGGQIDFNGRSFEVFTWASAIAAITNRITPSRRTGATSVRSLPAQSSAATQKRKCRTTCTTPLTSWATGKPAASSSSR